MASSPDGSGSSRLPGGPCADLAAPVDRLESRKQYADELEAALLRATDHQESIDPAEADALRAALRRATDHQESIAAEADALRAAHEAGLKSRKLSADELESRKRFAGELEALGVEPIIARVLAPLLAAAHQQGIPSADAFAACTATVNAAEREGLDVTPGQAFRIFLAYIESVALARDWAPAVEAQRRLELFNQTTAEYRKRYKEGKGALTFDEAVATSGLLPREGRGRGGVTFPLMFSSILEGFELYGKRKGSKGIKPQWKPRFVYRELLPRLEYLAYAQGDEAGAEWAKSLRARGTRLKVEGAARRLRGKTDPYDNIAWVMLVGHAIQSLSDCGPLSATSGRKCLAGALAKAFGVRKCEVVGAWERYPHRSRRAPRRKPQPKTPPIPIAQEVRCARCGKRGRVPLYRLGASGRALCLNCREWRGN